MLISLFRASLHAILVLGLVMTSGCLQDQQSDPVATLEALRDAIVKEDWGSARELFSEEIQKSNAEAIGSGRFYVLDYWRKTRTVHNLFASPPILTKDAKFEILEKSDELAVVSVAYPDIREKDVRLQRISLSRDAAGNWRVIEVFGQTSGIQ